MRLACLSLAVLLLCSCATKNVGPGGNIERPFFVSLTFSDSTPVAGDMVTGTINFQGTTGAVTFDVVFSNCVTPAAQSVSALAGATSATFTFTIDDFLLLDEPDGKSCAVTVTGVDANGSNLGVVTGTFSLAAGNPFPPPIFPVFVAATCTVTVTVADPDGDDVTVWVHSVPPGLIAPPSQTVTGGNGTADFVFTPHDIFAGGSGTVTFKADRGDGFTGTGDVAVACPPITLADDTLYAIPLKTTVNAGERVRIVVASGDPASPFRYLTGVRVTVDQNANALYVGGTAAAGGTSDVPASLNAGAVGGQPGDIDGFWTHTGATSFLLPPDNSFQRSDAGGGMHGFDFNLIPHDGHDVGTGAGALFNFELEFPVAGVWTLGFQDFNVVSRTYYQDSNQSPDYFWGDSTNNHPGVPNTVTVL